MAVRRMFSKNIISSGRFLRLPQSSRLLYYDLGMAADDDGIVEAFSVLRSTGATEDDLRILAARSFVTVLNDDLVSYINAWRENNHIRKDRYTPSVYAELLVKIDGMLPGIPDDNQVPTVGIPDDNHWCPQDRLGKDRLGKDRAVPAEYSAAAADDRPDFNTVEVYAANNLQTLSPGNMEELASFKAEIPDELIRHAIDEACAQGKRSWAYVRGILNRYELDGINTVGDAKARQQKPQKPDLKWA